MEEKSAALQIAARNAVGERSTAGEIRTAATITSNATAIAILSARFIESDYTPLANSAGGAVA